jgi:hypothetical protein
VFVAEARAASQCSFAASWAAFGSDAFVVFHKQAQARERTPEILHKLRDTSTNFDKGSSAALHFKLTKDNPLRGFRWSTSCQLQTQTSANKHQVTK